ncbi:MAG: anaerobic ribonucleoside-triphosphate reductase activating protein [Oscillospiraceae bacterium]|nr:anaerobic ribonucleoside-triphosphate reductase activating protein [Oscillospiraceae bacterium]
MIISGLQKMTLLDYPGRVACTVFLQGCNFRCPFCHNSGLLGAAQDETIPVEELLSFLRKRTGILDGVCITGGEPTLQSDLPALLRQIKALGYHIKLDTNGSRPDMLKALVEEKLIDYVAMDVKNCPDRYGETTGLPQMSAGIEESIAFLLTDAVDYEFRTTVVEEFHTEENIMAMGQWLARMGRPKRLFLQPYADRDSVLARGLSTPTAEKLNRFKAALAPYAEFVEIRGAD